MKPKDKYLKRVEARQAEATLKGKRHDLDEFEQFVQARGYEIGEGDISSLVVEDYLDHLLRQGFSDRTVQSRIYSVSGMYSYLTLRNVVDSNPADDVELGFLNSARINQESKIRYISKEDFETMVRGELPLRDELCIRLLWNTGARASEAVDITLDDLNRDDRSLILQDAKEPTESRRVYYSRRMARRLREYLDRGGRAAHLGAVDSDRLLVSRREPKMSPQRVGIIVRDRAAEVGIQETVYTDADGRDRNLVTAHTLRHSFAVHRVNAGMDISLLSELMGHSDLSTTKTYLQFSEQDLREADEKYRP
jgi:integrase/recombinase XerD